MRLVPVVLALLWGLNWPAVKIALGALPPFTLRALGLSCGAVLLLLVARSLGRPLLVPRNAWRGVIIAGSLNIAAFNLATAFAQLTTTTSRAAILTFTMPLWSALLARTALGERLDRTRCLALGAGATGLVLLALPILAGEMATLGLVFPLLAALGWAAGTVYQKGHPIPSDGLTATAWQLATGAAIASLGMLVAGEAPSMAAIDGQVLAALAFHIVGATALAYTLWFAQLSRVSATTSALTTLMIPVVGVLGAMALVGDRPSGVDLLGFAAILLAAGLVLFRLPADAAAKPSALVGRRRDAERDRGHEQRLGGG